MHIIPIHPKTTEKHANHVTQDAKREAEAEANICICVCVCVCVNEREKKKKKTDLDSTIPSIITLKVQKRRSFLVQGRHGSRLAMPMPMTMTPCEKREQAISPATHAETASPVLFVIVCTTGDIIVVIFIVLVLVLDALIAIVRTVHEELHAHETIHEEHAERTQEERNRTSHPVEAVAAVRIGPAAATVGWEGGPAEWVGEERGGIEEVTAESCSKE